ncbi:MAG: glycosyltransferase [Bryobacterales bacterium]|nr:glycosyltransferase [Bryobacterales bacterium]
MTDVNPELVVIICSANRAVILHETLVSLARQTHSPEHIVVCVPDETSVLASTRELPRTRIIIGPRGLTAQRNFAVSQVASGSELILFLDDDVELVDRFIARIRSTFARCPDVVLAGGVDIGHGESAASLTREAARHLLDITPRKQGRDQTSFQNLSRRGQFWRWHLKHSTRNSGCALCVAKRLALEPSTGDSVLINVPNIVGCAMCVRRSLLFKVRFDERLVRYGYLEDLDFSSQCRRHGGVVVDTRAILVHLTVPSGRSSELRRGFSEVMNPLYIWSKGNASFFRTLLFSHLIRRPLENLVRSGWSHAARERLKGNLVAFSRLLRGALEPDYVLNLRD